jgi:elongation factor P--(R)-beta-lysine ligase
LTSRAPLAAADEISSPHELLRVGSSGARVRVGGRLLRDAGGWQLADAFESLRIEGADAWDLAPGSLVVLEGQLEDRCFVAARLVEEQRIGSGALLPELERMSGGGLGRRLQQRALILSEIRRFFEERGFLEVDTPIRSAECGTEVHVEPIHASGGYLITSPELHMKRLLVAGIPKLFQIAHCFRAGELGPLHSPEFTMLEWYRAFAAWPALLEDTEQLLHGLCVRLHSSSRLSLMNGQQIDLTPPFLRLSVREAFRRFAGVADAAELAERDEDQYFQLLVDRVEPGIASQVQPVFLHDYPASQAALARLCPSDPSVAERFELYLGGIELCNGYGELNDGAEQRLRHELDRKRRRALDRFVPDIPARFVGALEQGMPAAAGNALGLDRLIALLCGQARIDAVRPFPDDAV